jgi:hypothetical protein
MKRIRAFLESIVFAGLKPDVRQPQQEPRFKWLGPLGGPLDRLLAGGPAPTDPLYLTNRTLGQKLQSWSFVAVPCLVLLAGTGYVLSNLMDPPDVKPAKELTASEVAAKMLPEVGKNLDLPTNRDVEVVEVKVQNSDGAKLVGTLRNITDHEVASVEIIVDLTDLAGSQLGAVNATVEKIQPRGTKTFQLPIKQTGASLALVREINSR